MPPKRQQQQRYVAQEQGNQPISPLGQNRHAGEQELQERIANTSASQQAMQTSLQQFPMQTSLQQLPVQSSLQQVPVQTSLQQFPVQTSLQQVPMQSSPQYFPGQTTLQEVQGHNIVQGNQMPSSAQDNLIYSSAHTYLTYPVYTFMQGTPMQTFLQQNPAQGYLQENPMHDSYGTQPYFSFANNYPYSSTSGYNSLNQTQQNLQSKDYAYANVLQGSSHGQDKYDYITNNNKYHNPTINAQGSQVLQAVESLTTNVQKVIGMMGQMISMQDINNFAQKKANIRNTGQRNVYDLTSEEQQNKEFMHAVGSEDPEVRMDIRDNPAYSEDEREEVEYPNKQQVMPSIPQRGTILMAPKAPRFNGQGNPEIWLKSIQKTWEKCGVHKDQYFNEISFNLDGLALEWFERNEETFKGKFNRFASKFLEKYYKNPEIYESKILTTRQKPGQSLEEYLTQLQRIASPAKLSEQKIKIAFIQGLREGDIKRHARQQFLFQNTTYDLDKILFSLQEYEYDSRSYSYGKKDNNSGNNTYQKDYNKKEINTDNRYKGKPNFKGKARPKVNIALEKLEEELEDEMINEEIEEVSDTQSEEYHSEKDEKAIANVVIGDSRIFYDNLYVYVISGLPPTERGNRHQVVITSLTHGIICQGGIQQKTRYHIGRWLTQNFMPAFICNTINTSRNRWFGGYFTQILLMNNIEHNTYVQPIPTIIQQRQQLQLQLPSNPNWDATQYIGGNVPGNGNFIISSQIMTAYDETQAMQDRLEQIKQKEVELKRSFTLKYTKRKNNLKKLKVHKRLEKKIKWKAKQLKPLTQDYELQENNDQIIQIHNIYSQVYIVEEENANAINTQNLHKELAERVKKAKYIPAKDPRIFAQGTLANMSLAQVLEQSPKLCDEWITYIQECQKKQSKNQIIRQETPQVNLVTEKQSVEVLKGVTLDYVSCYIYGVKVQGMLDTGANVCLASHKWIKDNNLQRYMEKTNRTITVAHGKEVPVYGIIQRAPFSLDDTFNVNTDILITTSNTYKFILGRNVQKTVKMSIQNDFVEYENPLTKQITKIGLHGHMVNMVSDGPLLQLEEEDLIEDFSTLLTPKYTKTFVNKISQTIYPNFPRDKKYEIILIDPPWQYQPNVVPSLTPPYKTLNRGQLQSLPIKDIIADNCILLMWITGPMIEEYQYLKKEYGNFQHRTLLFNWVKQDKIGKPILGKGNYTQPCTELLFIASKGSTKEFFTGEKVSQLIEAPLKRHSEKPQEFFKRLEKILKLDKLKCLEIFARKKNKYFDAYGDEIPSFFQENKEKIQVNAIFGVEDSKEELSTERLIGEIPIGLNNLTQLQQVKDLLKTNSTQFASTLGELGITKVGQHTIKLKEGYKPCQQTPYRLSRPEMDHMQKEVQDLQKQGFIKEEVGEWASPTIMVKKPNGKYRMCIDFRKLNLETIDEKYPIPRIDDIFAQLQGAKYFSKLDLKSGFWQIPIKESDQKYTGFITPYGQYYWLKMPFGLKNAPSTFQRSMIKTFSQAIRKYVMIYIDDIIIYSKTYEDHITHLKWIFNKLKEVNLKLGPEKCTLFQQELDILGHTIKYNLILPMKEKVAAIEKIKSPKNKTEVRSFLGLTGYYRQFIPNFSKIAQPLYKISGETQQWEWQSKQQEAFQKLKLALMENPILHLCVEDAPFTLYTDFSYQGIGAVLTQLLGPKKEMVIEFASRTLTSYEQNLDPYQGEVLAVHWSLNRFRHYLLGRSFTLVTDNKALEWVIKLNNPSRKINRWLVDIMEYTFTIKHRKGINHNNADALSRLVPTQEEEGKHAYFVIDIGDIACKICQQTTNEENMILCDNCGDAYHTLCHIPKVNKIPNGPWYCQPCISKIKNIELKDITLDFNVQNYLKNKVLPDEPIERNRVKRRGINYILQDERIFYISRKGLRLVPTIAERPNLIKEVHSVVGHQAHQKTLQLLQQNYIWNNMYQDVSKFVKDCSICTAMNPKYNLSKEYTPTEKGTNPFEVVAIDLITNLPKSKKGNIHIIVAIDAFSKYVELGAIPNKNSQHIRDFLIDKIICRHGCPLIIRSDQGTEFKGAVKQLIEDYKIQHRIITTAYPQANAQAERTVQTVSRILRKFMLDELVPIEWDYILPYVERSMRVSTSKSTKISPFEIIYGRKMRIPESVNITLADYLDCNVTDEQVKLYVKSLTKQLCIQQKEVDKKLYEEDIRQKQEHDKKYNKTQGEIKFKIGQMVYLKRQRHNKFEPPVFGPFTVLKYLSKYIIEVQDPSDGRILKYPSNISSYYCINFGDPLRTRYQVEQVLEDLKVQPQIIRLSWKDKYESNKCILKITEKDLYYMGSRTTSGPILHLNGTFLTSLVRNGITGRPYHEAFYFCKGVQDTVSILLNLQERWWRFNFYEWNLEIVSFPVDFEALWKFTPNNYMQTFYTLHEILNFPERNSKRKDMGVLFLLRLVLKIQTKHGVETKGIMDIHHKTGKVKLDPLKTYRYTLQEGVWLENNDFDKLQSGTQAHTDFSVKVREDIRAFQVEKNFLQEEKSRYPETYRSAEIQFLKNTFEGAILYGKRPYLKDGRTPFMGIRRDRDYMRILRNTQILEVPYKVWCQLTPEQERIWKNRDFEEKEVQEQLAQTRSKQVPPYIQRPTKSNKIPISTFIPQDPSQLTQLLEDPQENPQDQVLEDFPIPDPTPIQTQPKAFSSSQFVNQSQPGVQETLAKDNSAGPSKRKLELLANTKQQIALVGEKVLEKLDLITSKLEELECKVQKINTEQGVLKEQVQLNQLKFEQSFDKLNTKKLRVVYE